MKELLENPSKIKDMEITNEVISFCMKHMLFDVMKYLDEKNQDIFVKNCSSFICGIKNASKKRQIKLFEENKGSFSFIQNPCLEVIKRALEYSCYNITHIEQTLRNQRLAIRANLSAIRYIHNPFKSVQMEVVKKDPKLIMWIENPCKEAQLEACNSYIKNIRLIKSPCKEVKCLVYGEITTIVVKNNVCNKCGEKDCSFLDGKHIRSKCFIRSKCHYLIEHGVLS